MRKINLFLTSRILCFVFSALSGQLIAQTHNSDCSESPYFLIPNIDTSKIHFSLASTDVKTSISGVIANVEVTQTYINKSDTTIEASYVFPMSTRAAIYAMQMFVGGRKIEAVIKKKDEAKQIYDSAKTAGQTASLLIQNRPNVFQMDIANIFAGDTVQIQMKYTELLTPEMGVYEFVFPSIVGTRYTLKNEQWEHLSPIDSALATKTALSFDVKINAGMAVDAQCVSHVAPFTNISSNRTQCTLTTTPGKDFIVHFTLSGEDFETGLLLYPGEKENYFLAMIHPPKTNPETYIPKREYVFIMDVSGSMSGIPLTTSKSLIIDLISKLNPQDLFNVLWFSDNSEFIFTEPMTATQQNISNASTILDNLQTLGGTQMLPALQKGLNVPATSECAKTIVLLTDGYVDIEKEAFQLIRANLNNANFFAFGIGESVNRYFIEGVSYVGQGTPFVVTNTMDVQQMSQRFREYISKPVLTDISATFSDFAAFDVEPYTIPDVFEERPILLYGKYTGNPTGSITINGKSNNKNYSKTINIGNYKPDNSNIALKYLWARNKIKLLDDYGVTDSLNPVISIKDKVTKLGLDYHLVTQYTAFVAVDTFKNKLSAAITNTNTPDKNVGGLTSLEIKRISDNSNKILQLINSNSIGQKLLIKINTQNLSSTLYTLVITNIEGKQLVFKKININDLFETIELPIDVIASGNYILSLIAEGKTLESVRFIKQ